MERVGGQGPASCHSAPWHGSKSTMASYHAAAEGRAIMNRNQQTLRCTKSTDPLVADG